MLTDIRVETLKSYGIDAALAPRFPDPAAPEAAIRDQAANSAARWDANSQIILRRALLGFDTRPGFREDQSQVALRPVPHWRAVSTKDRARCDQGVERGRCGGALFRARQRSRPFLQRPRARQMVADIARVPGAAGRPAELRRLAGDPRSGSKGSCRRTWIASAILVKILIPQVDRNGG